LEKLGKVFKGLSKVEQEHHDNYSSALTNLEEKQFETTFKTSNEFLK